MKFIIELPDNFKDIRVLYSDNQEGYIDTLSTMDIEQYIEPDREAIENEVWEMKFAIVMPEKVL